MAGTDNGDLFAALKEFFDRCVLALDTTPEGAPDCRYVAEGPPPWDVIPSLTVHAGGPVLGDTFPLQPMLAPGHRVTVMGEVNLISITATILRCATQIGEGGDLPTADDHEAVAAQTSADLWAIWNHVKAAKRAGLLFAPKEREFFLDPAVAIAQREGAAGWQITVRTQLDGYAVSP